MNKSILVLIVILAVDPSFAQQSALDSLRMPWEQFRLSNGLHVVLQPDPHEKEISIEFWVHAGMRNEEPGKFGLAHFAEHATPYGFPGDTAALARFRSLRTGSNAQTRKDYTRYFVQMKPEGLELALQYTADRLSADTSLITDMLVEQHRKNVLAEIERNSSNAFWGYKPAAVREAGTFGAAHPYGHGAYGTPQENESFTTHDIRDWCSRFISPSNAILFVIGGFDAQQVRGLVKNNFERLAGGRAPMPVPAPRAVHSAGRVTLRSPSTLHTVSLLWALPEESSSDDAALWLLAHILDARLADSTKMPASSVEAGSGNLINRYEFAGQFGVYAKFSSLSDSADIEHRLANVLTDVVQSGISEEELRNARRAEIDRIKEMMGNLGFMSSRTELLGEGILFAGNPDHYLEQVKKQSTLTTQDVQSAARKWLSNKPFRLLSISAK
ncbi:MAG TPA: pitrilysin family protein [Bacteroidota bacterium]